MTITVDILKRITGNTFSEEFVSALNATLSKYDISTPLRVQHFLAQLLHESGGFRYVAEIWGPTPAQKRYDTRVDLGNTPELDGDGKLYKGRGFIQLTGKANYKKYSEYVGVDFVANPDLVSKLPYNLDVSGWFWNRRGLNKYADLDDIKTITKRINGGLNGFEDRLKWYNKCKTVLG